MAVKNIVYNGLNILFNGIPEEVMKHAFFLRNNGWRFYLVDSNRGFCSYSDRTITVPLWVTKKETGQKIWYLAHEMAHAFDFLKNRKPSHHGKPFMAELILICPPEFLHYETDYKPRNAKSMGISEHAVINQMRANSGIVPDSAIPEDF